VNEGIEIRRFRRQLRIIDMIGIVTDNNFILFIVRVDRIKFQVRNRRRAIWLVR
jgi:hypothetical protein